MEFNDTKTIYLQIAERICDQILSGVYKENERIPSVRETGASLEVNPNTVVRSYDYLQTNNILFNKRGIGYFVSAGASDIILDMRRSVFMSDTLPQLFDEMDKLGISIDEVSSKYMERVKS
ncbi:MAG: GntR family transcriptional regulator [Bacteroidales bacterium]|nr:GntR family transcriptional regulator [Bacteroidales bacterium]